MPKCTQYIIIYLIHDYIMETAYLLYDIAYTKPENKEHLDKVLSTETEPKSNEKCI